MRGKLTLWTAGVLVVALGATLAFASDRLDHPTKLTFRSKTVQQRNVDLPPVGQFNLGDEFVFGEKLYRNGKEVGKDGGTCYLAFHHPNRFHCDAVFHIDGGQVAAEGLFHFTKTVFLAVTGGTGTYRNARGQVTVTSVKEKPNQSWISLYLIP